MSSRHGKPLFLITHEFFPRRGGIATYSEEMALAGNQLGYEVEVWAQQASPEQIQAKKWPFKVRRLPLPGSHDPGCLMKLMKELIAERRRLRYATVYLPEPGPMMAMMLLQHFHAFRPKRLILTFHGSEILRFHQSPLYRRLCGRLITKASRVSTLTRYTRDLLLERFPMAEPKTLITPGALRSDFAVVHTEPKPDSQKLVVLTVARLHPRKGQLLTLQALQALPSELRQRVEYWIVGGHSKHGYEQDLRNQAAKSELPVRFFGDVSDSELDLIYDRADLFAMTSIDHGHSVEGFGLVYLEAAAHCLPVIGHAVGGVPEAVIHNETGLLVAPDNPQALSQAFLKLLSSPEERLRLGRSGRDWALRHHWRKAAELLFTH